MAMELERRLQDVRRFYEILADLERRVGGKRALERATGRMDWPQRGVYFFFEPGDVVKLGVDPGFGMRADQLQGIFCIKRITRCFPGR